MLYPMLLKYFLLFVTVFNPLRGFWMANKFCTIIYHLILMLLIIQIDFDISVANDIAIEVAKWALPGKVMQGSD